MKILFVDSAVHTGSVTIHLRNCREIVQYLNEKTNHKAILKYSDSPVTDPNEQYDIIVFSYGSFYFDYKKYEQLILNQKTAKIGWITNEYDVSPNSAIKKHVKFVISNFVQNLCTVKVPPEKYLITNLNTLIFGGRRQEIAKKYDCLYYGTFREDRVEYFRKYLQDPIILSTSSKNHKLFKSLGCRTKVMDKLNWDLNRETLNLFKSVLYIEDKTTHENYNHLANRFYEAISCNAALFFDSSCKNTIAKSGYSIDPFFIVDSASEIKEKLESPDFGVKTKNFLENTTQKIVAEKEKSLEEILHFLESL